MAQPVGSLGLAYLFGGVAVAAFSFTLVVSVLGPVYRAGLRRAGWRI